LDLAKSYVEKGHLLLGGAHPPAIKEASLVFKAPNESVVRQFVSSDPYVNKGVVTKWEIKEWAVVVGPTSLIGKVNL